MVVTFGPEKQGSATLLDIRRLSGDFSVSPQIELDEVQTIKDAGFKSIICNRPDGEDAGQEMFADICNQAEKLGLHCVFIPMVNTADTESQLIETRNALINLPKPVLAYCRSGTRCTVLWAMLQMGRMQPDAILAATSAAGYNMSGLFSE